MSSSLWFVICAAGALWVRLGMALHLAGMLRSKNAAGGILRSIIDIALVILAFWAVGATILATPGGGLFAWRNLFGAWTGIDAPVLLFLLSTLILSSGIITGVVAERSKFLPMCVAPLLIGGLIGPIAFRWEWGGWLDSLGFHDFAGAGPIHLASAIAAAGIASLVGPRMNKYNRDGSSNAIPGHSVPLASIGVMLIAIAWLPAVLGFAGRAFDTEILAPLALNILLAGAAGGVVSLLFSQLRYGKPDIHLIYSGLLGALVAITAIADAPRPWMAALTGALAAIVVIILMLVIDLIWKIDDPTGGIAIHGVGAIVGLLAAGLFAPAESLAGRGKLLGIQLLGIAAIAGLSLLITGAAFFLLKKIVGLRSKEADEFDGLDLAEHDIGAYPDFQQTTIKSYHLREA